MSTKPNQATNDGVLGNRETGKKKYMHNAHWFQMYYLKRPSLLRQSISMNLSSHMRLWCKYKHCKCSLVQKKMTRILRHTVLILKCNLTYRLILTWLFHSVGNRGILTKTGTGIIILPTKNCTMFAGKSLQNYWTHLHQAWSPKNGSQLWSHPKMGPIEWCPPLKNKDFVQALLRETNGS